MAEIVFPLQRKLVRVRTLIILRLAFFAAVMVSVLPYGAVNDYWLYSSIILIAVILALSTAVPLRGRRLQNVFASALGIVVVLSSALVLQAISLSENPFANPAWMTAQALIGGEGGSISVNPAATLASIPKLVAPFFVFMSALALFQDDTAALRLWLWLAWFGTVVAAFSLLQFVLFPDMLLFERKEYYLGSLTAVFVNRNTGATFLGISALLVLGMFAFHLRRVDRRPIMSVFLRGRWHFADSHGQLAIYGLLLIMVVLTLLLTTSRAGIASSLIALIAACTVMALSFRSRQRTLFRRLLTSGIVSILLVGFFIGFGQRALQRADLQGWSDGRWCTLTSVAHAISDFPIFGTGFGAFEHVFPAYRNPQCGDIYSVWYRAHNSLMEGYLGLGILFPIILIVVTVILLKTYLHGLRVRRRYRFAPLMCLSVLLLVFLHSLVDFSLQIHGVAVTLAAMLAAGVNLSLKHERDYRTPWLS